MNAARLCADTTVDKPVDWRELKLQQRLPPYRLPVINNARIPDVLQNFLKRSRNKRQLVPQATTILLLI